MKNAQRARSPGSGKPADREGSFTAEKLPDACNLLVEPLPLPGRELDDRLDHDLDLSRTNATLPDSSHQPAHEQGRQRHRALVLAAPVRPDSPMNLVGHELLAR